MAFNPPIPPGKQNEASRPEAKDHSASGIGTLVQAERLMQIAILLPSATLIGWGIGWWIDSRFHTKWVGIAGLVFGMIAGMVSVIRMALDGGGSPRSSKPDRDEH